MTTAPETADDLLWRRSKLGLHIGPQAHAAVQNDLDELRRRPQATFAMRQGG